MQAGLCLDGCSPAFSRSLRKSQKKALAIILFSLVSASVASAQNSGEYDVFIPIAKYIRLGDAEKLSAWFAGNLEIAVFSDVNDVSRNQAKQIMKNFLP